MLLLELLYSATLREEGKTDVLTCSTCSIHRINGATPWSSARSQSPNPSTAPWLPPHSTRCIGIGSWGFAHQVVHMCTCPQFCLLHPLPPHSSMHRRSCLHLSPPCLLTPSFIASFLHPLPVLPHSCMPVHCCLCFYLLIQAFLFIRACAALVCVCVLIRCCCIVIVSMKH